MQLRPTQCLIYSLAVPGLAHFLLGRPVRGVLALVSTVGLLAAGLAIVGSRLWYAEAFNAFGVLPLMPELLSLGPTVIASALRDVSTPELQRAVQLPVPGEHLGFLLAGMSGPVAALWMADAVWIATGERRAGPTSGPSTMPSVAAAVSWLVPGLGHVLAGQRSKGLLLGAAVLAVFFGGVALGAGHSVDRGQFPVWWGGQLLCGGGTILASLTTAPLELTSLPTYLDLGVILCTMAGLMNVMVMTDAYTVAEGTTSYGEHAEDGSATDSADASNGPDGVAEGSA